MTENLRVRDFLLRPVVIKTGEVDDAYVAYHRSTLLNSAGLFVSSDRPVPVEIIGSSVLDIVNGKLSVALDSSSSVYVRGLTADGISKILRTNQNGQLEIQVKQDVTLNKVENNLSPSTSGPVLMAVRVGSTAVSLVGNNQFTPLIVDSSGRLFVNFGGSVSSLPFTAKGDLLTYDGLSTFVLEAGLNNSLLIVDDSTDGGIRWLSPAASPGSPYKFLRSDMSWAIPSASASVPAGPAGGDLTGTYPNPTVAAVRGRNISSTAPAFKHALIWSGSSWSPSSPSGSSGVTDHGALTGLADDDHTQYFTSPRANIWLATKSTTNLIEGSNLYHTTERVQDVVGAMVSPSSTVRWTYNDSAGKLQAFVSPANIDHGLFTGLADDDHTQYHTDARADTWLTTKSTTNLTEGSNLYFTDERAQDAIGSALSNSTTVRWTYNDGANTISAAVSPTNISHNSLADLLTGDAHTQYLNTERGQDMVGAMVSPSSTIRWSYNDTAGKLQAFVSPANVDHGLLLGLADDDHTQYIRVDGSRAFTGDQSLGNNKITSLESPSSALEAANKGYVDTRIAATNFADLNDVAFSGLALFDGIYYTGSSWTNTNLLALFAPLSHNTRHVSGGLDEIDGDILDIDFSPTAYTRTTVGGLTTTSVQLTSHLKGINTSLAGKLSNVVEDTTPDLGGYLRAGENTIGFTLKTNTSSSGSVSINWNQSNKQTITLTEHTTFTFVSPATPSSLILFMKQSGAGLFSPTWPATVNWPSKNRHPILATSPTTAHVVSFFFDGTEYFGAATTNFLQ